MELGSFPQHDIVDLLGRPSDSFGSVLCHFMETEEIWTAVTGVRNTHESLHQLPLCHSGSCPNLYPLPQLLWGGSPEKPALVTPPPHVELTRFQQNELKET